MLITSMKAHMEPVYTHHQSSPARPYVLQPLSHRSPLSHCSPLSHRSSSHRFAGD